MFDKILIANRGEIALRMHARLQGDGHRHRGRAFDRRRRRHARAAGRRERLHRPAAGARKLSQHPACSPPARSPAPRRCIPATAFSSENARFAEIVDEHGITFIGPRPEHIRLMGDKIAAKDAPSGSASRCVPGSDGAVGRRPRRWRRRRDRLSGAGQGRRRRRRARHEGRRSREDLPRRCPPRGPRPRPRSATIRSIWRNTSQRPRHIEIQVLGDGYGAVIHLGERDCSLQRRHQKVWRRAPRPALDAAARDADRRDGRRAIASSNISASARSSSSTRTASSIFIEMNTRLQVSTRSPRRSPASTWCASRSASPPAASCRSRRTRCSSRATPSNAASMPRTRAASALARQDRALSSARRPRRADRFAPSITAT